MPHEIADIGLADVQAEYGGTEGDLSELIMGEQVHIGGLVSSIDLADRARIREGMEEVDLCCCTGAGMRFLVRFRKVAQMIGVDATERMIERGRQQCEEEGLADRIRFIHGDACTTGLPDRSADFVWVKMHGATSRTSLGSSPRLPGSSDHAASLPSRTGSKAQPR